MTSAAVTDNPEFAADYDALTGTGGYLLLESLSTVAITGKDRATFLHSFCTNDVAQLTVGDQREAFLTDVKGKTIGHVLITCHDAELFLLGASNQAERIVPHLDRYVIREDVQLRGSTDDHRYLLISGNDENAVAQFSSVDDAQTTAIRLGCRGLPVVCLIEHQQNYSDTLCARLKNQGFRSCGADAWDALRIECGIPLYGTDFDDTNLPQEIGRNPEAISFTKGCYLGQETVARIDALGHVNQQIVSLQLMSGRIAQETPIQLHMDENLQGLITSACYSPKVGAVLGLGMVRRPSTAVGTQLASRDGIWQVVTLT